MQITASQLRQNIYQILDRIIEKGEVVEIKRKGTIIKLVPETKKSKIERLKENHFSNEPAEAFESIDWTGTWKGDE
jgi:antitoxin (DNA-binding transcriptional repressor) of toxin-antitoxin stability system